MGAIPAGKGANCEDDDVSDKLSLCTSKTREKKANLTTDFRPEPKKVYCAHCGMSVHSRKLKQHWM